MDMRRHLTLDWDDDVPPEERLATALLPDTRTEKRWLAVVTLDHGGICTPETPLDDMPCNSTAQ
jgi:hypothetical protein